MQSQSNTVDILNGLIWFFTSFCKAVWVLFLYGYNRNKLWLFQILVSTRFWKVTKVLWFFYYTISSFFQSLFTFLYCLVPGTHNFLHFHSFLFCLKTHNLPEYTAFSIFPLPKSLHASSSSAEKREPLMLVQAYCDLLSIVSLVFLSCIPLYKTSALVKVVCLFFCNFLYNNAILI